MNTTRNRKFAGMILAFVLMVAGLTACTLDNPAASKPGNTGPTATPTASETTELSDELRKLMDASAAPANSCASIMKEAKAEVVEDVYTLYIKSLYPVDSKDKNARSWSDALSTPLTGKDTPQQNLALKRAICEEPYIGVTFAHMMFNLKVGGVRVSELQTTDWMKPVDVSTDELDTVIAGFAPLVQAKLQNSGAKFSDADIEAAVEANREYQNLATKLVFLLERFELKGVKSIDSTHHYNLVAGGLRADGMPEVGIDTKKDKLPSLVYELTEKTACKPVSVIGFNLGDKRPMLGEIPDSCDKPTKKPNPEPTDKPTPRPTDKPKPPPTDKPTDKPKPPPTDKPTDKPKPPTCPPGQVESKTGKCINQKGTDPDDDYKHDPDKQPKDTDTTPPKETPDPVATEEPGGRDTTDSPTKKPGDESGVTAPDAKPAPTSKPSIPPNEGGDTNSTVDPGGF